MVLDLLNLEMNLNEGLLTLDVKDSSVSFVIGKNFCAVSNTAWWIWFLKYSEKIQFLKFSKNGMAELADNINFQL